MNLKHKITIKNSKIVFHNRDLFNSELQQYNNSDAYLIIKPYKSRRSDNQNRYYWGVVIKILAEELGYLSDEMHEILKYKFLAQKDVVLGDETLTIPDSSANLNTTEFEKYLAEIRMWASRDLDILIPQPNEVEY